MFSVDTQQLKKQKFDFFSIVEPCRGNLELRLLYVPSPSTPLDYRLGLTLWNLSCLEFKFDDTRHSYWHKNKIGRIDFFFFLLPDFPSFLPYWLAQFCWDSQQDRELAKSRSNKKKFQFCQSYSYVNRESLVSSNLNSKQLRFHGAHPA
jgi:hypothetical protein